MTIVTSDQQRAAGPRTKTHMFMVWKCERLFRDTFNLVSSWNIDLVIETDTKGVGKTPHMQIYVVRHWKSEFYRKCTLYSRSTEPKSLATGNFYERANIEPHSLPKTKDESLCVKQWEQTMTVLAKATRSNLGVSLAAARPLLSSFIVSNCDDPLAHSL